MKNGLLVKYGEIAIRGKNRYIFEAKLIKAIRRNMAGLNPDYYIAKEQGRLFVFNKSGNVDLDSLIPRVAKVFGVVGVCPCVVTEDHRFENLQHMVMDFFVEHHGGAPEGTTFCVVTKRADKAYPMNSNEISAALGEMILQRYPKLKVKMKNPDIQLRVELRNDVYIYSSQIKGPGGLPAGSSGKGVLLLSGGIDSPVAGYLMGKRGIDMEAVYFHSPPYTSERAKEKVIDLAKQLALFCGELKLHVIPFTKAQLYLYDHVPAEKMTIFLKRAMLKTGQAIGETIEAKCLILGDSVGQVASQTLHSIHAVESAVSLPILRPLSGFDKQEIVNLAKQIDTFDISIRPYEDCCTIFVAEHPETKPKASVIERMEQKLTDLDRLLVEAIENREIITI